MSSRIFLAVIFLFLPALAAAQPASAPLFVPFGFPAIYNGSIDFGDVDGDGDLDVGLVGSTLNQQVLRLYQAVDSTWYLPNSNVPFSTKIYRRLHLTAPAISLGVFRWGDFDADGDDDFLIAGHADHVEGSTRINGPFLEIYESRRIVSELGDAYSLSVARTRLPGVYRSAAEWADYDDDGDLDFVVSGLPLIDAVEPVTRLYRNDEGTFREVDVDLPGIFSGDVAWADYDGDGDLDLALTGDSGGGVFITRLYRNEGGQFTNSGVDLPGLAFGSLDWGDYDGDGDADLLLAGGQLDPRIFRGMTKVYKNEGGLLVDGGFDLDGHVLGEAYWGDADRDGDLDIFALGAPSALKLPVLRLYAYDGSRFVRTFWNYAGVRYGTMAVGDYNLDGDADVIISGRTSVGGLDFRFLTNRDYPECVDPAWLRIGQAQGFC